MMDEDAKRAAMLELDARFLARRGTAKLDELQALVDRARELLASGEIEPDLADLPPLASPFAWELSTSPSGQRGIWLGSVEDFATGAGHRVHAFACMAWDEDHARRLMAASVGRILANGATLGEGIDAEIPFVRFLLPIGVYEQLEEAASDGSNGPALMAFLASYHVNYT